MFKGRIIEVLEENDDLGVMFEFIEDSSYKINTRVGHFIDDLIHALMDSACKYTRISGDWAEAVLILNDLNACPYFNIALDGDHMLKITLAIPCDKKRFSLFGDMK